MITTLPPEPNADPAAIGTLQGTGGAACAAATVYPNIVVAGSTVATGLAPAPIKDASGFYHFKPSCYGYLNPSSLSGAGISNLQVGPETGPSKTDVIPSLPSASTAGTLLVADLRSDTNASNKPFTAPAGWVSANSSFLDGAAHTEIWYYPNNPGGITSADFGVSPNSIDAVAQMTEWSGVAAATPLDKTGTLTVSSNQSSVTISTSAATTAANELVITDIGAAQQSPQTYSPGAGWTGLASDMSVEGFASEYRLNLPAAVASETVTVTKASTWSAVIAAFKPAVGGGAGAVLDPGFYYFNGSGFGGGGGICLNGGTLLARDVTLEFVNQAGFSSGDCTPGGGVVGASPDRLHVRCLPARPTPPPTRPTT